MATKTNGWKQTIIQLIWLGTFAMVLTAGVTFFYISKKLLPDTQELENPNYEIASVLLARDGSELGKVFTTNRVWLEFKDINPLITNALVAKEDERFYAHNGIDIRSVMRAVLFAGERGGGSTITQQLAKQFFTEYAKNKVKRVWQKLKEWVIAVEFEKRYTKEEILAMYLNKFDFWYNAIGVGTASKIYFGKDQSKLLPDEAAILVAMLKNPNIYNPKINPENAFNQRNVVLMQMNKTGKLTDADYKKYSSRELDLSKFKSEDHYTGSATYFRSELTKWVKKLLAEDKYKSPDGTNYDINTSGLKIYTTIDANMQKHAEAAALTHMGNLQKRYDAVWKGMDPWTYKADAKQKEQRNNLLITAMRNSERFIGMRKEYLKDVSKNIYLDIPGSRLYDGDIFRLFAAEKDKKHLDNLIKNKTISSDQADTYRLILESEHWPTLKSAWNKLKADAEKVFAKPTQMKVFDYSTGGEKSVTMSPMDSVRYYLKHLQFGSLAVDPKTGEIKAWVGGINHKYFQFDHVTSNRQVGSTFKPFIYGTAIIDQAMSPCFKVQDVRYCIPAGDPNFKLETTWCPSNAEGKNSGSTFTLRDGLKESKNSISVYLMKEIGNVERVRSFVSDLGIDINKIPKAPSICLGTPELSVMDMATAYTAFANNGVVSKPFFISRIEDKNGRVIYSALPEQKKVINPSYNWVIVDMLKYVASIIQPRVKSVVAGKTGTTNDYKDGWFVGFTPNIVVATWVGGDHEFIRFNTLADGQGSVMARPFFESFLKKIEADPKCGLNTAEQFAEPADKLVETDCSKYVNLRPGYDQTEVKTQKVDEVEEEF
ncbi:MAG: transglycosylase domain-containing protein [Saprospiraceae bacterium]|nr:transglycosylase domain-containing protein [Saprospiraceae bacterium]